MTDEIAYLKKLVNDVIYDLDMFTVKYGDGDKVIMGVLSQSKQVGDFFEYKTLFDTVIDVDWKVKKSLMSAIDYAYKDNLSKFNPALPITTNEREAAYFTENAVFRTIIKWDLLAQMYNIKYGIQADTTKIYYKNFFKNCLTDTNAAVIAAYIEQDDNTDVEPWQGNHKYVNDYRNQMTHRNSPNVTTISNYDFQMRMPMRYVLKRVIEDYSTVSSYINTFLNELVVSGF